MANLETAVNSVLETILWCNIAGTLRGKNPITNHQPYYSSVALGIPGAITSNTYITAFQTEFTVEDVGLIEVLTIYADIITLVQGDGAIRWQISGVGGGIDANWTTFIQRSFNIPGPGYGSISRSGSGLWINSINTGNNQLQIRLQALANSGTVNLQLDDGAALLVQYRQKIRIDA